MEYRLPPLIERITALLLLLLTCRCCLKAEERLSPITAFYIALKFKAIIYPFALG